jgi:hypothetical protein
MTIYLEKNKKGEPTGVWIVEVRRMTDRVSKTIRRRTRDYSEAKRIEASLRGSPVPPETGFRPPRLPVKIQPLASSIGSGSNESQGIEGSIVTDMSYLSKFTLRNLYDGARSIYRGNKDQKQSEERLYAALEILGWDMDLQELRTPAL